MNKIRNFLRGKTVIMLLVTVVIAVIFNFINAGFLTMSNLTSLMITMSLTGMLCVGMVLLLISGEVNLASGAEAAMGGIILALLLKSGTMSWPVALLITLLAGVVMGLINAFFVNGIKLMSFITTIAMMSVYMGLARILTNSQNIAIDQKYASFYSVGSGYGLDFSHSVYNHGDINGDLRIHAQPHQFWQEHIHDRRQQGCSEALRN